MQLVFRGWRRPWTARLGIPGAHIVQSLHGSLAAAKTGFASPLELPRGLAINMLIDKQRGMGTGYDFGGNNSGFLGLKLVYDDARVFSKTRV
jgi:hypothetical protein